MLMSSTGICMKVPQIYYHGEDFRFTKHGEEGYQEQLDFI